MNTYEQIRRGILKGVSNPRLFLRELNRVYFSKRYGPRYNHKGVDIFQEEWDTLVIFDACRYDMFVQQNSLPGRLEHRTSRGSHTSEFLRGNFHGRSFYDTVYTTASPQLENRRDEINVIFHAVNNIWNTDRWDPEEGTVHPEEMTDAAIEAHAKFPNKRHIIHYMQPHYPFIGADFNYNTRNFREDTSEGRDIWGELFRGELEISTEKIWSAYRRNLDIAFEAVQILLKEISGKIVITSDHGNIIGERASPIPIREWGHPPRLYISKLAMVPWLVLKSENRRRIKEEPSIESEESIDAKSIEDRLNNLGYL